VAVKIKLKRLGKIRQPFYRIVVADARTARNGRAIEEIGVYRPKEDPSYIEVDSERVKYWLGVGAQPTSAVEAILKVTGDWQSFKGLPAPEPMKVAAPRPDKKALYEAAAKEAGDEPKDGATTPRTKKSVSKADAEAAAVVAVAAVEVAAEVEAEAEVAVVVAEVAAAEAAATGSVEDAAVAEVAAEVAVEAVVEAEIAEAVAEEAVVEAVVEAEAAEQTPEA
jgi:small subunit ribosomal protein S16